MRVLLFLCASVSCFAANGITTVALVLKSTFECISVRAPFTGDDNGNATIVFEYSTNGGSSWLACDVGYIDRRTTVGGVANPGVNDACVSVVGLSANTSYQVRATWTDADGVTGTNPRTATISTQTRTPPLGGATTQVANNAALAAALAAASPGDTLVLADGNYTNTTISISGNSGAWIKIAAANVGGVTITGAAGFDSSLIVSGSYLWFYGINTGQPEFHGFDVTGDFVQIEQCTIAVGNYAANDVYATGVYIEATAEGVRVYNNTLTTTNTTVGRYHYYVLFKAGGQGSHIIDRNTTGWAATSAQFVRDGIGSDGGGINDGPGENTDIAHNNIKGVYDDGIEAEGGNRNVRIFDNYVHDTDGDGDDQGSMLGFAGTWYGPSYVFRNFFVNTTGITGVKQGNTAPGPSFLYHNTWDLSGSGTSDVSSQAGGTAYSLLHTWKNNVMKGARFTITGGGRTDTYDYDLHYRISGTPLIDDWDLSGSPTDYNTLALFTAGTGQEAHGAEGSPLLNSDGTLQAGSPAINLGVPIPNFNGANSAWPITGAAPDAGLYEYQPITQAGSNPSARGPVGRR